jgi:hypothetical protein
VRTEKVLRRQVGEASNTHTMGKSAIDGRFNEIGWAKRRPSRAFIRVFVCAWTKRGESAVCVTIRSEGITTAKTAKQVSTPQNGNTANLGTEAKHPELTAQKAEGADPECFMHSGTTALRGPSSDMILYIAIAPVDAAGLPSLHKAWSKAVAAAAMSSVRYSR